jgi:hypothetical protein
MDKPKERDLQQLAQRVPFGGLFFILNRHSEQPCFVYRNANVGVDQFRSAQGIQYARVDDHKSKPAKTLADLFHRYPDLVLRAIEFYGKETTEMKQQKGRS